MQRNVGQAAAVINNEALAALTVVTLRQFAQTHLQTRVRLLFYAEGSQNTSTAESPVRCAQWSFLQKNGH